LGVIIKEYLFIPLPANVIGLILFTICLFAGWVKLEWVQTTAELLIKHMLLFFLPFLASVVLLFNIFEIQEIVNLIFSIFISTVTVILITGWTVQFMNKSKKGKVADRGELD
jgi:holin-like protein